MPLDQDQRTAADLALIRRESRGTGLEDPVAFVRYYLKDAVPSLPDHVIKALQFYATPSKKNLLWICPVGHSKSTTFAFCAPIWEICRDRNIRMVLAAKAADQAIDGVRRIKVELETNRDLTGSFGEFFPGPDAPWTNSKIQVKRDRNLKGATMTATGLGGAIEGSRLNRAFLDDVIDIGSMTSEAERVSALQWYKSTLRPRLDPGGKVVVVGTPWHPDDVYSFFRANTTFAVLDNQAIVDGKPLWPEQFGLEELQRIREDIGELAFQQKYMCRPTRLEGNLLKLDWLHYFEPAAEEFRKRTLEIRMGVDPAISKSTSADYSAISVCGKDRASNEIFQLESWTGKVDFPELITVMNEKAAFWHPQKVAIEENAYQAALLQAAKKTTMMPVVGVKTTRDKVTRILALSPYFENGKLQVRKDQSEFVNEYANFPSGSHDDALDALEICVHDWISTGGRKYGPVAVDLQALMGWPS